MQETNKRKVLDFLETKVIFRISRMFIWFLVSIVGLSFIVAFLLFLYSLLPTIEGRVKKPKYPPEITITLEEIQQTIKPPSSSSDNEKPVNPDNKIKKSESIKNTNLTPSPSDTSELALEGKIETLKSCFPEDKYTWTTISERTVVSRDYWGNPTRWGTRIKVYGLENRLYKVLSLYEDTKKKIDVVKELLSIIPNIDMKNRGKALEIYTSIRTKKEKNRRNRIDEIESEVKRKKQKAKAEYLKTKENKALIRIQSLGALGSAFVSIAVLGLFLVFLAIERNTRAFLSILKK